MNSAAHSIGTQLPAEGVVSAVARPAGAVATAVTANTAAGISDQISG